MSGGTGSSLCEVKVRVAVLVFLNSIEDLTEVDGSSRGAHVLVAALIVL